MTSEKLIDKLRKLRNHAESAKKIGSQAEAEAFAAMFQRLLLEHKIDASDVDIETQEREEPVGQKYVAWEDHDLKYGNRRVAWIEQLTNVVCRAYFCRFLVTSGSSRVTLVGRKTDVEIAEYMLVTLIRAAETLVRKEYQVYRRDNPGTDTRGFQVSFMAAFVGRLAQRYREERAKATSGPSASTALVRVNRAEAAVGQYMERYTRRASSVGQRTRRNEAGAIRGRAVADSLSLRANAIRGGGEGRKLGS